MNHTEFFKSLKENRLEKVYLFHGDEEYVKEQAFSELKRRLVPQFEELNISVFDTGSADEIIAATDVAPFMTDNRMTIIRFIPKDKDAKKLTDYMERIPDASYLVFYVHGKADAKMTVVKDIKSRGGEVLFDFLNEDESARWVVQQAGKCGCTISIPNAKYMVELVGRDMLSVKNELSKLCDYVGEGGTITKKIIPDIVIKNLEFQLYSAYAYFTNGKMQDGFRAIENGKDKDQESFGIAGYFLSCLKAALTAHDLLARKASESELISATGKRGYALKDLCNTSRKFKRDELLDGITRFANVSRTKIVFGMSSYDALRDAIIKTFRAVGSRQ